MRLEQLFVQSFPLLLTPLPTTAMEGGSVNGLPGAIFTIGVAKAGDG